MSLDTEKVVDLTQNQDGNDEFQHISAEFVVSIVRHFREYVKFIITSGTFAYGGATKGKSDVDILVVCEDEIAELSRQNLSARLRAFIGDYVEIHRRYDYCPDTTFPGEYIMASNVEDALAGRGFHVTEEGALHLPMASDQYYMQDAERWYRAWRSSLAFGKRLYGNEEEFVEVKNQAWEIIILYVLLQSNLSSIDRVALFGAMIDPKNKWNGIGITEKYRTFREDERIYVESALIRLSVNGFLFLSGNGAYMPNMRRIKEWERDTVTKMTNGSIKKAPFLITLEEAQELAQLATSMTFNK